MGDLRHSYRAVSAHAQKGPCFFRMGRFRPPEPVARITRRACRLTYADFVKASQASRLALPPNNLNAVFTPKLVALGSTRAAHRAGRHSAWVGASLRTTLMFFILSRRNEPGTTWTLRCDHRRRRLGPAGHYYWFLRLHDGMSAAIGLRNKSEDTQARRAECIKPFPLK